MLLHDEEQRRPSEEDDEESFLLLAAAESKKERKRKLRKSNVLISISFIFLGLTAFILSNAFWAELAIFFRTAPEGSRVAVYIILALQCANIWPILYVSTAGRGREKRLSLMIWLILVGGFCVSLLLACFHSTVVVIGGRSTSLPLFILAFLSASCSASSNVTYYPLVGRYPQKFTTALVVGESLSGFVAGFGGILQNSGGDVPRFSPRTYFLGCAVVFLSGMVAFRFLQGTKVESHGAEYTGHTQSLDAASQKEFPWRWHSPQVLALLAQQALFGSLAYGFIPSISTIMVDGYKRSSIVLQWSCILGMVADPIARALTFVYQNYKFWLLTPGVVLCAFVCILCAAMAPFPPLHEVNWGGAIPIMAYTSFQFLTGFTLTMCLFGLRCVVGDANTEVAYRWSGFAVQAGAFIGSAVAFVLVIIMGVFAV